MRDTSCGPGTMPPSAGDFLTGTGLHLACGA